MSRFVLLFLAAATILTIAAYLRRRAVFRFLGPVFFFDAVRQSRRGRFAALRAGYALLLLTVLFIVYRDWAEQHGGASADFFTRITAPPAAIPKLGANAFYAVSITQLLVVFLLTPAYTARAIAEEKEHRTLELLFACGLTSREIVVGKLAARLAIVLSVILTGLPVVVLLTLLGGVGPGDVLINFGVTLLTAISLAAVGLYASVRYDRAFDAATNTYFAGAVALFLPCALVFRPLGTAPLGVELLMYGVCVSFCGVLMSACLISSVRNLRASAWAADPPARPEWRVAEPRGRPPLDIIRPKPPWRPLRLVLWKENYVEPRLLGPFLTCVMIPIFIGLGTFLSVILVGLIVDSWTLPNSGCISGGQANPVVRPLGLALVVPSVLLIGLGSAGRLSRERERGTLDSLLSTALGWRNILLGKALASVQAVSYLLGTGLAVWLAGLIAGGINAITFPLLLLATATYVAFAAALGLYCSAVCRSTVRAQVATLVTLIALTVLPLLTAATACISPPVALWQLGIGYDYEFAEIAEPLAAFAATVLLYGTAAAVLAGRTRRALGNA